MDNPMIPEQPFDWTDWAEVPDDFEPMTAAEMEAALEAAKDLPDGPPKAPGQN